MPTPHIDISGLFPGGIGLDVAEIQTKLDLLAEMALHKWTKIAQKDLQSTSADYINGLQPVEHGNMWAAVHLVGWLPNAIENGLPPFDMKPGLLSGPNAKWSKFTTASGRSGGMTSSVYNTVPFRHGTPGTSGKNVGAPMPTTHLTPKGKPASVVYDAAKKLAASKELPSGKTAWGGKTGDFGGMGKRTMLPVAGGRPGAYTWKHSPYEGIYKIAKTYAKATQHQYISFRRVSSNSDPNAFWHPGIKARHFAWEVEAYALERLKELF